MYERFGWHVIETTSLTAAPEEQPDRPPNHSTAEELSARIAYLYEQHGEPLRRFLWGVLRDNQLAADVLQATFVKLMQSGGPEREEAEKAWLFRVAYRTAMAIRRRESAGSRVNRKLADSLPQSAEGAVSHWLGRNSRAGFARHSPNCPPSNNKSCDYGCLKTRPLPRLRTS